MPRTLVSALLLYLLIAIPTLGVAGAQATATCDDFKIQAIAQLRLTEENAEQLDPDGDGVACEELPGGSSASGSSRPAEKRESKPSTTRSDELTKQEERYFAGLLEGVEDIGNASTKLGELFLASSEDPTLLRDQDWIIDIAAQFYAIQQIGVDAEKLQPSARQQPIHDLWLESNRLTTLAVDDFTKGIDNLDSAAIIQGSGRYNYAALLVNDLTAAVEAFADDPNEPIEPEHVIAPVSECDAFSDYEEAQLYYAANPEEQGTIDPDFDGLACEVFFERE